MKRLLCIVGSMDAGGAETFLMKIYRQLDKTKYQMDFAVATSKKGYYDDEILAKGGKIYLITPKSNGIIKNFSSIKRLVREKSYQYVLRTSQHSLSALELLAAKLGGAKVRVFRSSNSNTTSGSKKQMLLHKACIFMPALFANVKIAPSTEAAEFMFGKDCIKKGKAFLLHNAIDLDLYKFDKEQRAKYRNEFNIENKLVIGHIGRFNQQKNHKFLIDIFDEVLKRINNAVLLLIGKGELEEEITQQINKLGISDKVIFTGVRSDIPQLLSAMDVFVMPSFYEGMPNTIIESQATGLSCVISDTITKEANITGLVRYISLNDTAQTWAEEVGKQIQIPRKYIYDDFISNKYDIQCVVDKFVELIFETEDF